MLVAGLTPQAVALYATLLAHVNRQRDDGVVWPGLDVLAEMLGFKTRKSVSRYISELAAIGAVDVERQGGTMLRRNVYVVHEIAPASHVKPKSLAEFYAARKVRRGTQVPLATVTRMDLARGTEMPHNQTNATTRSQPDEPTTGGTIDHRGRFPAGGRRASSPTDGEDQTRKRLKIRTPKDFHTWDDPGRVMQYLIGAALRTMTKGGLEPHSHAADGMGRALKDGDAWRSPKEMALQVEDWVNQAGTDHKNGWLGTPSARAS